MQLKLHMVTIEDLVPQEHFLRKLEAVLDLSFVYRETEKLYSRRYGRPPIDPVMLVKYLLVGYLYGIPSERQIEQRIQTDVALRWYLGLDLLDRVPDHSTISQLRRRKPSFRKVFRRLFEEVVEQCVIKGLASGRLVATVRDKRSCERAAGGDGLHPREGKRVPGLGAPGGGSTEAGGVLGASGRIRGRSTGGAGAKNPGGKDGQETEAEGAEQTGQKPSSVRPEMDQPHGS